MGGFWLKFFGIDTGGSSRVVELEFAFRAAWGGLWWVLVVVGLVAGAVWLYRREVTDVPKWRRYLMAGLRAGVFVLLMLMLLRPTVKVTTEGEVRRQLVLLLDASASMGLVDQRVESADVMRAAMATGRADPAGGLEQALPPDRTELNLSREQLVRSVLTGERLGLLERLGREHDLRVLSFGREVRELSAEVSGMSGVREAVEGLRATEDATALGDAIREALDRTRGQPLAGMLVVTDGASNAGMSPVSAAQRSGDGAGGVPLYLYGVGLTRPRDLAVSQIFAPENAFVDDEVVVSVRLRGTGVSGQTTMVRLKLGDRVVREELLALGADGELTLPLRLTPTMAGEFVLTAEAERLAGEVATDNNSASTRIRVVDGKIKVLYVESQPRWEFKYLQAMLLRDRRVEAKFLLLEASAGMSGEGTGPYVARFPVSREELFGYDLLILGEVDPSAFSTQQLTWIEEHVSRFGAGLVFLAGRQRMPWQWSGTNLEKLVPVEWDPAVVRPVRRDGPVDDVPRRLELTAAGRLGTMLRLAATEVESAEVWSGLPPVFWTAPVSRARAAAEVLVVDADPQRASRFGPMPVIAVQQFGVGTTLFVGTDNLWRWRRNVGDEHHTRLWGQMIQRLALPHLLGESRRTQLSADRRSYFAGQSATLFARLYSTTYEPVTVAVVRGVLRRADGTGELPVQLRPMPDQPGMYRGEVILPAQGEWRFSVETDPATQLDLEVTESRIETSETAMNEPLLRDLARISGGAFLREEDLHTLPDLLARQAERVRSTHESEVWSSPAFFLLLLGLLGAEWAMRKGASLK